MKISIRSHLLLKLLSYVLYNQFHLTIYIISIFLSKYCIPIQAQSIEQNTMHLNMAFYLVENDSLTFRINVQWQ